MLKEKNQIIFNPLIIRKLFFKSKNIQISKMKQDFP
jgi:hypothetical protein